MLTDLLLAAGPADRALAALEAARLPNAAGAPGGAAGRRRSPPSVAARRSCA